MMVDGDDDGDDRIDPLLVDITKILQALQPSNLDTFDSADPSRNIPSTCARSRCHQRRAHVIPPALVDTVGARTRPRMPTSCSATITSCSPQPPRRVLTEALTSNGVVAGSARKSSSSRPPRSRALVPGVSVFVQRRWNVRGDARGASVERHLRPQTSPSSMSCSRSPTCPRDGVDLGVTRRDWSAWSRTRPRVHDFPHGRRRIEAARPPARASSMAPSARLGRSLPRRNPVWVGASCLIAHRWDTRRTRRDAGFRKYQRRMILHLLGHPPHGVHVGRVIERPDRQARGARFEPGRGELSRGRVAEEGRGDEFFGGDARSGVAEQRRLDGENTPAPDRSGARTRARGSDGRLCRAGGEVDAERRFCPRWDAHRVAKRPRPGPDCTPLAVRVNARPFAEDARVERRGADAEGAHVEEVASRRWVRQRIERVLDSAPRLGAAARGACFVLRWVARTEVVRTRFVHAWK